MSLGDAGRCVKPHMVHFRGMKRAYLIHGWGGRPTHGFFPWLKAELENRGYAVEVPLMPDADAPRFETWVPFLESLIRAPNGDTLVLGHSMGGQAALRYLERLPEGERVGTVALVAPVVETITGMSADDEIVARPWLSRPFDADKIRRSALSLVGIFSDDDPFIPLSSEELIREEFGAMTQVFPARGHFSGDGGCVELPEILPYL